MALTWKGDVRALGRDLCFDVPSHNAPAHIILYVCHGMRGNQHFTYDLVGASTSVPHLSHPELLMFFQFDYLILEEVVLC